MGVLLIAENPKAGMPTCQNTLQYDNFLHIFVYNSMKFTYISDKSAVSTSRKNLCLEFQSPVKNRKNTNYWNVLPKFTSLWLMEDF